jgi:hypothetical protein
MNLTLEKENANTFNGTKTDIIDEDIDDAVGEVTFERGEGPRQISLYGRYKGTCGSHEEAVAFIKGVEAVLNRLIG